MLKQIINDYNPEEQTSFLMYFDVNKLYGVAMSFALPVGNFHWINSEDIYNENFMNISADSDIGYILEVDLHYPKEIFESHKDLPLCPEHLVPPLSDSNVPICHTLLKFAASRQSWNKNNKNSYLDFLKVILT
jgi:hypothetical protein